MRNPTSYNLKLGFTTNDIDRIYDTLRRRARAAFVHQWSTLSKDHVEGGVIRRKFEAGAQAIEAALESAQKEARMWGTRGGLFSSEKERLYKAQELVNNSKAIIREYEATCFQRVRGARHIKSLTDRKSVFGEAWTPKVRAIVNRAKSAYPFITSKNIHRIAKAVSRIVIGKGDPDPMRGYIPAEDLLAVGIPASELAGPWYDRKKFKKPIEWVRYKYPMANNRLHPNFSSPTMREWMTANNLDENDRQLRQSIENYYSQHRDAPSVAWAQRRQNELEKERQEKEIEDNVEIVQEWLEASKEWRLRDDVFIPVMPDPSYRVANPIDAHEICRRAAKDGLCVVDRLKDMVEQAQTRIARDSDGRDLSDDIEHLASTMWNIAVEEDVVTLVLLHDQQYRTIIGLNADGVCTSEHHCTGRNNELDKNAWEYFRAK